MAHLRSLPVPPAIGRFGLVADWRDFVMLHFTLPPEVLTPHVPFVPDRHGGQTVVSLVAFRLLRVRPAWGLPPTLGRLLMRAVSDHEFLNLRTYVRGPVGPGIQFLAEWIDNPLSLRLGPLTYGLPYRRARLRRETLPAAGLRRLCVEDRTSRARALLVAPTTPDHAPTLMAPGSVGEFLLERHLAYTHRRGVARVFAVHHAPWRAAPFQLARYDTSLIEAAFPWFRHARFLGGHVADGFRDVKMSLPWRVATNRVHTADVRPAPVGAPAIPQPLP